MLSSIGKLGTGLLLVGALFFISSESWAQDRGKVLVTCKSALTKVSDLAKDPFALVLSKPDGKRTTVKSSILVTEESQNRGLSKYSPFRRLQKFMGKKLTGQDGILFKPTRFLTNYLVNRPVELLTGALGNPRRPNRLATFALSMMAITFAFESTTQAMDKEILQTANEQIAATANTYQASIDQSLEQDFRYKSIRASLLQGEISKEEARILAVELHAAFNFYYETVSSLGAEVEDAVTPFSENPLFYDLVKYLTSQEIPVTAESEIAQHLFDERHLYFISLRKLDDLFFTTKDSLSLKDVLAAAPAVSGDESYLPYIETLVDHANLDVITQEELRFLLQQTLDDGQRLRIAAIVNGDTPDYEALANYRERVLERIAYERMTH